MAHDRFCPLDSLPEDGCVVCGDLKLARNETRDQLLATWTDVLVAVEKREYARGWQDGANGRPANT